MKTNKQEHVWQQPTLKEAEERSGPRICMPTFREITRETFRCGLYEAQDVLADTCDVDLIRLKPERGFRFKDIWLNRLLYRPVPRSLAYLNPGLQTVRLTREYDLFIAVCQFYQDLPYINAIQGWKDQCKTSICWIDEMWVNSISSYRHWLHVLDQFDYVFMVWRETAAALSKVVNRTCHWLPGAADVLRFSPYPNPPARVIDVYSIGRRYEGIHNALLQAANRKEILYVHDTLAAAGAQVYDHRQHRDLFANLLKRSGFFMVAPGKMDDTNTGGQVEIGYRYYEGAAAGATMIGEAPRTEIFREMFPSNDFVIPVKPDGSDVIQVLARLRSDPERVAEIGRRNARGALLQHDWIYRWKELFRIAGIESSPGMTARERYLKDLAGVVANISC